jgi:hypothetical protein
MSDSFESPTALWRLLARIGLTLVLLPAVCLTACAERDLKRPERHTLLKVWYSTGGPAPVVTELTVTNNDYLNVLTAHWQTHTQRVTAQDTRRVRLLLAAPAVQRALGRSGQPAYGTPLGEERVKITVGQREYLFVVYELPERVLMLLEAVDDLFSRRFGAQYGLRIPH